MLDSRERLVSITSYRISRSYSVSVILKIVYGYETKASQDQYVALAKEAMKGLSRAAIVGSYLVDIIPILKYVPCKLTIECGVLLTNLPSSMVPRCRIQAAGQRVVKNLSCYEESSV